MPRWRLTLAYHGGPYSGWQRQKNGLAVQQVVEEALSKLFQQKIIINGASRTDAGVHALGQVAHFDHPSGQRPFTAPELLRALNAHLPPTVRAMKVARAPEKFHAQFQAAGKRYQYRLFNGPVLPPTELDRAWQIPVPCPLDLPAMRCAAAHLIGTHDFLPFSAVSRDPRENTVRTLTRIAITRHSSPSARGAIYLFTVEGDGFLYKMVRSIVGALSYVGRGKQPPDWIQQRLIEQKRDLGIITAPPQGLTLVQVFYPRASIKKSS